MEIVKKIVKRKEIKVVSAAHWKEIDTGVRQVMKIIDAEGVTREEERPVMERVIVPARAEDVEKEVEVWVIERNGEAHEFGSLKDAQEYQKGLK